MAMPGIMGERAETCVLLEKTRVPDGEGGWETRWVDGPEFSATITHASSIEARVAESEGMTSTFTVWTEKGTTLTESRRRAGTKRRPAPRRCRCST